MGSLYRSKSANEISDIIVEEEIESHRRTRLTMAQRKLELNLMGGFAKERELFQDLRGGSRPQGFEMADVKRGVLRARGESSWRVGQRRYFEQVLAWLTFEHVAALRKSWDWENS